MGFVGCRQASVICWLGVLVLLCGPARGDVILTAENLNASLKELQRLERRLQGAATDHGEKAEIVLAIARKADALTQRFSDEIAAHGYAQKGLIELGLRRLADLGIDIEWSGTHGIFLYDGAHYREYLDLLPTGPGAAQSAYRLIYIDFFNTDVANIQALTVAAGRKREFLERFPESQHAAEVGFLLAIDYRDLWRHCRQSGDSRCSTGYETRTRMQLRKVIETWPGTRHAALAQRLLRRFDQETGGSG